MPLKRKYKVSTTITQYMWAYSRKDAEKYQEELIRKGQLDALRHGTTEVKYSFTGGDNFIEAPEDISRTRDPIAEPRRHDWLYIEQDGIKTCALITRLTRRKIYYYEGISKVNRSVDREQWTRWAQRYDIHPSYDGIVPPFIIEEAIEAHESRGMLNGVSATPDSSLILEILSDYLYIPDDYEVENGFWAEICIDQAISERILEKQSDTQQKTGTFDRDPETSDFSVGFSEELPTMDDFDMKF